MHGRGFFDRIGAVHGSRVQSLEQARGGPTIYTSSEDFTGFMLPVVPIPKVQAGFVAQGEALKKCAETIRNQ